MSPAIRLGDWVFLAGDLATDFQGDFGTTTHMGDLSAVAPKGIPADCTLPSSPTRSTGPAAVVRCVAVWRA